MKLGKIISGMKKSGITVIVADHRFYYLKGLIDRVFLVEDGRLSQFDSEEEFKKSKYDTRSFDLFKLDLPIPDKSKNIENIASLKKVNYKNILTDISLELKKGEVSVLVGNNGVGKTTLAKLLCKTIKPDNGEVNINELPFYIMQDPDFQLFGTSVHNELALVNDNDEAIAKTLKYLGLYDYKDKHTFDLSGGQKQRLQIGMAMLCDKPLIIFDEPTSGLDIVSMKKVAKEIVRLKENAAVLVISHDYEFIRNVANRIIYLKNGKVHEDFELADNTLCKLNNIFNNMEEEKMKNSFKMKDVVTIALLTALYMVFYMIVMVVITPLGPFGHAISPGLCAVITGSVLIFMSRKVGKMWQFTFMTAILMALFWIMGGGYIPWVVSSMVMAVIADFIASRDGKTVKIWKLALASGIMHVGQAWGAIIPSWFFLEQYKAAWVGRAGMTEESMNAQIQYTQGLMGVLSTAITFVLAFVGVYLGYVILKKHLKEEK